MITSCRNNSNKTQLMDFKDQLRQLSERIVSMKESIHTEEATKTSLIMPFIYALGYDVFNPTEVVPEMVCDIGAKKGEKIDYCILKDGHPIMLIECKHWAQDLSLYDNQLLRYFHVSSAKFGVLTNGIVYRFYTDLDTPNKMDETPFLEVNMLDLKDTTIEELKRFHKSYFNLDEVVSSASELKYLRELKSVISDEFKSPSPDFVKILSKRVYAGSFTPKVLEHFAPLVKRAISTHVADIISGRLSAAIKSEEMEAESEQLPPQPEDAGSETKVVTTEEEIEAYLIVKAILAKTIDVKRVYYRDAQTYFTIIIDDSNRKNICRLYLDSETSKKLVFTDEQNKPSVTYKINSLDDLYAYEDEFISAALLYK